MTTLTDLIKSAERKIADPNTTPQTREREKDIAHYLTAMQTEIKSNEAELAGYRRENMMLHTENKIQHEALTALRAENTKLYADLCEMGDMARERSRKRSDNVTISGNWDELLRHKWPEEKPEKDGQYLIRIISPIGSVYYRIRGSEEWHDFGNYITHWWNLPEVTE